MEIYVTLPSFVVAGEALGAVVVVPEKIFAIVSPNFFCYLVYFLSYLTERIRELGMMRAGFPEEGEMMAVRSMSILLNSPVALSAGASFEV